jgi:hypothetical protein
LNELPFIDEHARIVGAPPGETWDAARAVPQGSFGGGARSALSRLLGCEQTEVLGEPGARGSTFPGFRVARSIPPTELALEGSHRFSRYELTFRIDDLGGGRSRLRAESRAAFPGLRGRVYRALVIGTRGHVLAVRRLLAAIGRRAESGEARR